MELRILGPVEICMKGGVAALEGDKPRTVFATLLMARGRVLPDETMMNWLWGASPPSTAIAQICTYVSRLRKYLDPDVKIIRQNPGYLMRIGNTPYDFAEFERLAKIGSEELQAGQYEKAAGHLEAALALWRGRALANVTEFLAESHLPQLEEAYMAALEDRIDADLWIARHPRLVPELTGLVAGHPFRERLRAQFMTALYRCDRQGDAIAVFHEGRRMLAEELGVDPGATLRATYQAILSGELRAGAPTRTGQEQRAVPGAARHHSNRAAGLRPAVGSDATRDVAPYATGVPRRARGQRVSRLTATAGRV